MLTKPSNWDSIFAKEGTICVYKILIGSDTYTSESDIEDDTLKIYRTLFTSPNLIGNTPCFTLECCLRLAGRTIPRGATVKAQVALKNGSTTTSYIPLGTFRVYRRQGFPDGWVKLVCRDRMQMANQAFFQTEVAEDTWPKSMSSVLQSSAAQVGISIDSRTQIQTGSDWMVTPPVGLSVRAVWSYIAAAHGGNFYITPEDKLLLVTPKAGSSVTEVTSSQDGLELLGDPVQVDQVLLKINTDAGFASGTSGANDIEVDCPYANQTIADYVKSKLTGVLYTPVRVSDAWIDPALEMHDTVTIKGTTTVSTIFSGLDNSYRLICSADGIAENVAEPESEYGFDDTPLNQLKTQSQQIALGALDKLGQEEIFNKLTNNGQAQGIYILDGQLYINASYLQSGTLKADLIKAGILESVDGSFRLNLETGEIRITGYASSSDLEDLEGSVSQQGSDINTVKESIIDIQTKTGDLEVSITKIQSDGVDKVTTSMGYTFSDDGMHIQKPGGEMENTLNDTGMYVRRSGQDILIANTDGVEATDLKARNYLIIGEYSRLEDYPGEETALFWIGG